MGLLSTSSRFSPFVGVGGRGGGEETRAVFAGFLWDSRVVLPYGTQAVFMRATV